MTRHARIVGVGAYLPERVLTNSELEKMVDTSDEWIVTRTGIRERHLAAEEEATSHLATRAAQRALADSGLVSDDIDLLIVGTSSPDMIFPSTACLVQDAMGLKCPSHDVMAACTGFVYALQSATALIESGRANNALVIGADALTRHVDFEDRSTCVLFGDGAGAVVLSASDSPGVRSVILGSDGSGADLLQVSAGGSARPATHERVDARQQYIKMSGNEIFRFAARVIPKATKDVVQSCGLDVDDLAWVVPHQANQRIIDTIADRLGLEHERVFSNIATTGNTSAASIPLALSDLYTSGRLAPGDKIALVGFGAGLTWGAAIVEWTKAIPGKEK